jgi:hypothetical protein
MATEVQFDFFKHLYQEEDDRRKQHLESAKTYLSLSIFYSAFILFVAEKLKPDSVSFKCIFVGTVVAMLLAFLLSISATGISNYEISTRPRDIIKDSQTDEEFFKDRIAETPVFGGWFGFGFRFRSGHKLREA